MVGTKSQKTKPASELGEKLRQARLSRHLSVIQVANALHMPSRHIEALEEGDLGVFAAEIYARGACLKYAAFVGIESDALERVIWRALSASRERVPLKIHTAFSWFERLVTPRLILWGVVAAVGLTVTGYIIWQVQTFLQLPAVQLTEALPAVTSDETLLVKGTAESQATITLNEELIILERDSSFTVPLVLHPGVNVVRIEAENAAGRKAVIEQHVILSHHN